MTKEEIQTLVVQEIKDNLKIKIEQNTESWPDGCHEHEIVVSLLYKDEVISTDKVDIA